MQYWHSAPVREGGIALREAHDGDLVVVIPGILGSVLRRGHRQVWGYRRIITSLHRLASALTEDLLLPAAAFDDPDAGVDDGVQVDGVLRTVDIIPGFFSIDGYDELISQLRRRFSSGAIVEFPYDWRQSNQFTARLLQETVEPLLRARRAEYPGARLVLVGHSMGGLVARYYAECLDTRGLVHRVVTIGTPFSGAAKALAVLANGRADLGPARLDLSDLLPSLPSVAELLPMYPCVGASGDELAPLRSVQVPGLPARCLQRGLDFHDAIAAAVADAGRARPRYHAVLSHRQATDTWVSVESVGVVAHQVRDPGESGDGTVPRCSASPPEWADDADAVFVAGRHGALQQQREVLTQLQGILSARPRRPMAVDDEIAVDAPEYVLPGEQWSVRARSVEGSDALVLRVTVTDPATGRVLASEAVRPCGGGRYSATLPWARPGIFRWQVHTTPVAGTPVDPVADVLLCAGE